MRVWVLMGLSLLVLLSLAGPSLAAEEHGGDRSMFEKSLDLGLWTLVVFLILLFILSKFAWKPMLQGLEKREQDIAAAVEDARRTREKTAELQRQIEADRQRANDEARQIREDARKAAEQMAGQRQAQLDAKLAEDRERLLREVNVAKDQVLQETFSKLADLAAVISSKALRRELTAADHRTLVDEALADMNRAAEERQKALAAGTKA
jgi:F-type H+-transporting ATPase subunit b